MENVSAYRIATASGVVIGNDLLRSSPAIQLHEGIVSKGNKHPKDLDPGESSIVSYPLVSGRLICRVLRTFGDIEIATGPIEFVEPVPPQKKEKRNPIADGLDAHYAKERANEEPTVKVRRGRGKVVVP